MNERMKQLAEQAGMTEDKFGMFFAKDQHNEDGVDLEKFAELIVQECAKTSRKYVDKSIYSSEYEDCGLDCMSGDLEQHILEHFGVEE